MWQRIAALLLMGYFCLGRSFAYWGVPAWYLFLGEIILISFVLCSPRLAETRWLWTAFNWPRLALYRALFLIFFVFGTLQVLHGIASGHPILSAARDMAFNYYPLYFFLGLWIGLEDPDFLHKFFRVAAWVSGIYGILYIIGLNRINWVLPGVSRDVVPVPIFGMPEFSAVILLGLLSFEKDLARIWPPLLLNAAVLIGMLIRAEWLAFVVGLVVWGWCTKNLKRVALGFATILLIIALMSFANFSLAGPESRGGTISVSELAARVIAPIDSDLAKQYSSDLTDAQMYEGNVAFRALWWAAIWSSVHDGLYRSLLGYGYGFALGDLSPFLAGEFIRTPHNVFFYALGYTGWVGVLIFAAFQAGLVQLLWRVYQTKNEVFGIVFWVTMMTFSMFTPFFEVPQGAIPFYIVIGCACAPLFRAASGLETGNLLSGNSLVVAPFPEVDGWAWRVQDGNHS